LLAPQRVGWTRINQLEQQRQALGKTIDELTEIECQVLHMLEEKGADEELAATKDMAD